MRFSATKTASSDNCNGGIFAAIAIVSIALPLAWPFIDALPAYIHAWSQSDWYSIAIGFTNNGFDLFHPETLIYNKQYPGWWAVDYGDTITSVDFPIHEYIVALLMSLFGTTAPWVFHLWTLLCSLVGAWFLYMLTWRLTRSILKSAAAIVLYMTAPVYAYYFANFLPCAPALALAVMGLWAYIRHWQGDGVRFWHWAIALLGMATLVRSSQAVTLVAVCGFELIRILRGEEKIRLKWLSVASAFAAILAYHFWNSHLAAQHGTLFLSELRSPTSLADADRLFDTIKESWRWQYFSRLQHWTIAVTLAAATAFFFLNRKRNGQSRPQEGSLSLLWLAAIYWLGEVLFFAAMMVQFEDHDYYFLDSFFLPCILLFVLALKALPNPKGTATKLGSIAAVILLGGLMFSGARHNNRSRQIPDDKAYQCNLNYAGADRWLDSLGVSRDAKILSVFSYPQNTPFIQMGRKGYSLMWYDEPIIDAAIHFPADYAVIEDDAFRDNFPWQKHILGRLQRIAGNGRLSLCRMADTVVNETLEDFFGNHGFVGIDRHSFVLDGEPWFPLMLNYKAFIEGDRVVPAPWYTYGDVRAHFDTIAAWGFNAVRVCLDVLDEDGDSAAMYHATRRMVQQADSAGLHVMLLIKPPFEGYWRDYAVGLMRHLADLPALWAYDLLNEPLYFDPKADRDKRDAVATVSEWRHLVRTYAPHQLFTVATAEPIEVFEWDPAMLPVDFIEMHTYPPLRVQAEMWWYSHYCGKPWMVGETGLPADGDAVPYKAQVDFVWETYRYAKLNGAIGYGWWEFQDYPEGVNFEAQYTGLRDSQGRRKPAAIFPQTLRVACLGVTSEEDCLPPANYRNMLAYQNLAITGRVVDDRGKPVEGAVVRGWNDDWSVGMNTYTDSTGRFRLVSNDRCTHFEVGAPRHSTFKFDRRPAYPAGLRLPAADLQREYQQIPLLGWGDERHILPTATKQFEAPTAVEASIGDITLGRL